MNAKKSVVAAAVGLMGLTGFAWGHPAMAQDQASQRQAGTITAEKQSNVPKSHLRHLTLKVKDVDKSQHKVTFEAQISPEANIEKNGQPIKLDQLQKGDEVRAAFVPSTGEVVRLQVKRTGQQGQQQQSGMKSRSRSQQGQSQGMQQQGGDQGSDQGSDQGTQGGGQE